MIDTFHLFLYSPQVDLGFLRFVSAVGTQGAISQETQRIYFVKSYKVDVSSNGEDWITLKEGSKQKVVFNIYVTQHTFQPGFLFLFFFNI